jgi:hypothetical protein
VLGGHCVVYYLFRLYPLLHGVYCDVFPSKGLTLAALTLRTLPSYRHREAGEGHAQARRVAALRAGRRLGGAGRRGDLSGPVGGDSRPVGAGEELAPQAGERLGGGGRAGRGQRDRYVVIVVIVTNTCAVCAVRTIVVVTWCVFCSCSTVLRCCEMSVLQQLLIGCQPLLTSHVCVAQGGKAARTARRPKSWSSPWACWGRDRYAVHCVKSRFDFLFLYCAVLPMVESVLKCCSSRWRCRVFLSSFVRRLSVLFRRCSPCPSVSLLYQIGVRRVGGAGLGSALPGVGDLLYCSRAVLLRHHHAGPRALVSGCVGLSPEKIGL